MSEAILKNAVGIAPDHIKRLTIEQFKHHYSQQVNQTNMRVSEEPIGKNMGRSAESRGTRELVELRADD